MEQDRALDEYAARQYGTFSRDQAVAGGITRKMIETRLRSGAWIRLGPAVYALASAPPKWERQMAAALLTKADSIVAGKAAAYLHGFDGFAAPKPVIMVTDSQSAASPLARVIRSNRFTDVGRVRRRGFVVTDEAETVATIANDLSLSRLEATVDWLLARKTCSVADLARIVDVSGGKRGVANLRRIVGQRLPTAYQPPTSELERMLFRLLDDPRLPHCTRQMPMSYQNLAATVDAYIPQWRLIVEGDGRRWHSRRSDFELDRVRDNEATAHGFAVLRFTWEMLRNEPERCKDTLIRTGSVRAPA